MLQLFSWFHIMFRRFCQGAYNLKANKPTCDFWKWKSCQGYEQTTSSQTNNTKQRNTRRRSKPIGLSVWDSRSENPSLLQDCWNTNASWGKKTLKPVLFFRVSRRPEHVGVEHDSPLRYIWLAPKRALNVWHNIQILRLAIHVSKSCVFWLIL